MFRIFPDISFFERLILDRIKCLSSLTAKAKQAPVRASNFKGTRPLHLVHFDISGPVAPFLAGNAVTFGFLDNLAAKSDVFMISSRAALQKVLENYKARSENVLLRFSFTV